MADDITDLIEELDTIQGPPGKRSLTKREDLGRMTSVTGSLTDPSTLDIFSTAQELERHLDMMLDSIHDYQGFLSRTKNRI